MTLLRGRHLSRLRGSRRLYDLATEILPPPPPRAGKSGLCSQRKLSFSLMSDDLRKERRRLDVA